ncbi:thaumatin-like protein 1b [Spinacia oleracea]|uniref:Thaumatin-like protein 1b n=1 Tax=Spinacia oleracea TaxID=3562 RepID=A0A9R0K5R6_SPIOL|nr:thaumatin-like protein 1b [Spinacia oleracea]
MTNMTNFLALMMLISFMFLISGTTSTQFIFKNNCPHFVWPGILTGSGPPLPSTGFSLRPGASFTLGALPSWSGRIWARTRCSQNAATHRFVCHTADCASGQVSCNGAGAIPPASLVEFTLNGNANLDFYDVSLVDGYNLPISVVPTNGGCRRTGCPVDINRSCPPELQVKRRRGGVIACKSACLAFNRPEFCCTGANGTPQTCPPTRYSNLFKDLCPQAYSYAYDDKTSTFTCPSGSSDYIITFCP